MKKITIIQKKIIAFTDGGARGNPGPAAIGVVLQDDAGHALKSYGEAIGTATNNEAEYRAVILALGKIKALFGKEGAKKMHVAMRLDSEFVVKQLSDVYKIEEERLFPFFIKARNLTLDFGRVTFTHIPREQNREADRLVNEVLDCTETPKLF